MYCLYDCRPRPVCLRYIRQWAPDMFILRMRQRFGEAPAQQGRCLSCMGVSGLSLLALCKAMSNRSRVFLVISVCCLHVAWGGFRPERYMRVIDVYHDWNTTQNNDTLAKGPTPKQSGRRGTAKVRFDKRLNIFRFRIFHKSADSPSNTVSRFLRVVTSCLLCKC